MEAGLSPGDIVLDGAQLPSLKRGTTPNFRPMSIVVKRSPISATAEHSFYRPDPFLLPKQRCQSTERDSKH